MGNSRGLAAVPLCSIGRPFCRKDRPEAWPWFCSFMPSYLVGHPLTLSTLRLSVLSEGQVWELATVMFLHFFYCLDMHGLVWVLPVCPVGWSGCWWDMLKPEPLLCPSVPSLVGLPGSAYPLYRVAEVLDGQA